MTEATIIRGKNMKKGDTLPNLRVKLAESGDAFNLADYDVTMKMKRTDGESLVVDDAASIENETRGIITYEWSSTETEEEGTYLLEFSADDGTGSVVTFPNNGFTRLYIEEGL